MFIRYAGALALCALATSATAQTASVDSVIVTARPDPEDPPVVAAVRARLSQTPGSVAVVARESYAARFATGTADLLRDVPGVYAQKKWGGDTRLSIRGSGIGNSTHNRGTLLAQDGIPFNEADGFGDSQLIDPLLARYTEVYKGGNALRFGGALLGGAINLVTPTGRNAGFGEQIRIDGGAYDTLRGHVEVARAAGEYDAFAAATAMTAQGWRAQSEQQLLQGSLNIGRRFGEERELRLIVSAADLHQEIPGSVTLAQALGDPTAPAAINLSNNYLRNMRSVRGAVQARWRLDASTTFDGGLYASWKDLDHPIFQVIDQESRNWGAFGRFAWDGAVGGLKADAFWGAAYRSGDLDALQWINVRGAHGAKQAQSRQNAAGLDVFAEGRLFVTDRLALIGGGSWGHAGRNYDSVRVAGAPASFALTASKAYDSFAPRLGLLWQDDDGAQVFANLTRSVEPPNFGALAPTIGGFTPLRSQKAWTAEIGTRGRRGALTWDIAIYRAELAGELLNYTVDPALGVPAVIFNAGKTLHQGLEAGLDWRITPRLKLRQTYAWSDFRFGGDVQYAHNRLPVVPQHLYRAELRYDGDGGWFVAPALEWSPQDAWADYKNTLRAPGYAMANITAGWRVSPIVSLFLDVRNLADKRYVSNFSAVTDARTAATAVFFPGEGRSAFAGITLTM
jgi:iron complex outermembrane receptor protein